MPTIQPAILLRYNPVRTWPLTTQMGWVGVQSVTGHRPGLPVSTDSNTKYVAKTGSDGNAGTSAAPYLTVDFARSTLGGAFVLVQIKDSGLYQTAKITWDKAGTWLYAADGQIPTIAYGRGVGIAGPGDGVAGAYGARLTHGNPSNPPGPFQVAYVSKSGNNGTAVKGNPALPFLTIQAAITATVSGDFVRIQDSGTYIEDISAGAKAVTIQAATNCNPTLVNVAVGSGNAHIQNSGAFPLTLTSLNLQETVTHAGKAVLSASAVTMTSCTVSNSAQAIQGTDVTANNSYFYNATNGILASSSVTVQNCLFAQAKGVPGKAIYLTGTGTLNVSWSSFLAWCVNVPASWCILRDFPTGTFNTADTVTSCILDGFYNGIQFGQAGQNPTGTGSPTVTNLTCSNGVNSLAFWSPVSTGCDAREILFQGNTGIDLQASDLIHFARNWTCRASNLVSIGNKSAIGAFATTMTGNGAGAGATNFTLTCRNCTVVNATNAFAIWTDVSNGLNTDTMNLNAIDCIEAKCGTLGILTQVANSTKTFNFNVTSTVYDAAVTIIAPLNISNVPSGTNTVTYLTSINADAKLLSSYPGQENVGLDPTSPAMGTGSTFAGSDRGVDCHIFNITANGVTVSGIRFMSGLDVHTAGTSGGGQNLHSTVRVDAGVTGARFMNCTFNQYGPYGIKSLTGAQVLNCEFRASDGVQIPVGSGVILGANGNSVQNNTFASLPGAAVANLQINNTINYNSTYACLYGHYDNPAAVGTYTGNVLASSGALDYSGRGTQNYSCIGTVSIQATLTSCSRLDPLYRDPDNGDLRLETVSVPNGTVSFPYDSPAHNLVLPGPKDAGAFLFTYGPIDIQWTGFTLTYNPDEVLNSVPSVNLAEGFMPSGRWYSSAEAFPQRYLFTWGPNNPMPAANLASLLALFSSNTGEAQVSFNAGSTWVPVRVERGPGFEFTDMDEAYNVVKPQPLRQLALVAST